MLGIYLNLVVALGTSNQPLAQAPSAKAELQISESAQSDFDAGQQAQAVEHDFPKAIQLLSRAIATAPDFAMAYGSRGATYFQMEDYRRAADDFSKALQVGLPPLAEAQIDSFLGLTFRRLGKIQDAIQAYSAYLGKFGDNWNIYMQRGEAYEEAGDYAHAHADFDKALVLSPDNAEVFGRKVIAYAHTKDFSYALNYSNKYLSIRPSDNNVINMHMEFSQIVSGTSGQIFSSSDRKKILDNIVSRVIARDRKHGLQISHAIQSSPALKFQLGELASAGTLTDFMLLPATAFVGPFGGMPEKGSIRISIETLDKISEPNAETVAFFLGFQAAKLQTQESLQENEKKRFANLKPNKDNSVDITEAALEGIKANAIDDARALIVGWDDSLNVALSAHQSKITEADKIQFIRNLPFGQILTRAASRPGSQMKIPTSLIIELRKSNMDAISNSILGK